MAECGCRVIFKEPPKDTAYFLNTEYAKVCDITYCPLHRAASQMRENLNDCVSLLKVLQSPLKEVEKLWPSIQKKGWPAGGQQIVGTEPSTPNDVVNEKDSLQGSVMPKSSLQEDLALLKLKLELFSPKQSFMESLLSLTDANDAKSLWTNDLSMDTITTIQNLMMLNGSALHAMDLCIENSTAAQGGTT